MNLKGKVLNYDSNDKNCMYDTVSSDRAWRSGDRIFENSQTFQQIGDGTAGRNPPCYGERYPFMKPLTYFCNRFLFVARGNGSAWKASIIP